MEGRRYEPVRHVGETEVDVVCGSVFDIAVWWFGGNSDDVRRRVHYFSVFYAIERQMKAWKGLGGILQLFKLTCYKTVKAAWLYSKSDSARSANASHVPRSKPYRTVCIKTRISYLRPPHSFAPSPSPINSAPAPAIQGLPVSTTIIWKMTLLPSFQISVLSFCPGRTVPANLTLMFLKGPKVW